jgi:NUMOD3 motif
MVAVLEDFILVKNGPGRTKRYKMICDSCGAEKGYHRLRDSNRLCQACKAKPTIPANVSPDDFIIKPNSNNKLYRTSCIKCEKDKGYVPVSLSNRQCKSCSSIERHGVIEGLEFVIIEESSGHKRIRYKTNCSICGKDTGLKDKFKAEKKDRLCRSCVALHRLKGRKFSEESKIKMSESQKKRDRSKQVPKKHTEETKKRLSEAQKQYCAINGNQFVTGRSAGRHSKESISKISTSNLGKEPKWKGRVFQYIGPKGSFKMRSSYELVYAEYLDSKGIEWEYEPQYILSNGSGFAPDFRLGDGTIVEVKGYWTDSAKLKWELFKSDNSQLHTQVIMKSDLLDLGLEV